MPYYVTDTADGCSGWAVTKDDGEIIGCHTTKQDAIDQMVAVSIEEDIEPGGERNNNPDAELQIDVPRDGLVRKVEFRAKPSADGLTLEGYAAVFNQWTEIDSYEGNFREQIAPGAFKRSIDHGRMPVLQFDHGTHPLIGSLPLGVITSLREDTYGLKVHARLSDNWLVEPVRDAIRDGAIHGMSFRFKVINDKWTRSKNVPERTITELKLYEVGPVVFPAYEQTAVGVRTRDALTSLTDPQVRGELAKLLAFGTSDTEHADTTNNTDSQQHSVRTRNQRRALALLTLKEHTK
jgi:HK97 family phage prohead protease